MKLLFTTLLFLYSFSLFAQYRSYSVDTVKIAKQNKKVMTYTLNMYTALQKDSLGFIGNAEMSKFHSNVITGLGINTLGAGMLLLNNNSNKGYYKAVNAFCIGTIVFGSFYCLVAARHSNFANKLFLLASGQPYILNSLSNKRKFKRNIIDF